MKVVEKKIEELIPYAKNPRKNDAAIDKVAASIREFGFKVPVVIDNGGVIVAGHTRVEAAKKLGLKTVPAVIADDLSEEQIKAFRLADNKTAEYAEWDFELLDEELQDICDIDMSEFGFDVSLIGEADEKILEDDVPEPPKEPQAKVGDLYQLGNHRLICGDCTDVNVIDRLMDGAKADMVFTDPPYNVSYSDKNKFLNEADKGNRIQEDIENDSFEDDKQAKDELWIPAFSNMRINASDYCSIYVTMPQGGAHMMMMMMGVHEAGWQVKHELIWVKNNHVLGRTDYFYKHEPILFGWNKKHKFYGEGDFDKSVWEIPKPQKSDLHPTMKPLELIANALRNSTKKNDSVLDVFGGSGSTLIACEQLNRKCYMCELEPKYIDVIIKRWETLTGEKAKLIDEKENMEGEN